MGVSWRSKCRRARARSGTGAGFKKGIPDPEFGEKTEITVSAQQSLHTVGKAERRDAGVVNDRATHPRAPHEALERAQEILCLTQENDAWRCSPRVYLSPRFIRRAGCVPPDSGVGDHAEEFAHTRPRYRPSNRALAQGSHHGQRNFVLPRLTPMGIDEHIRVDGNHGVVDSP